MSRRTFDPHLQALPLRQNSLGLLHISFDPDTDPAEHELFVAQTELFSIRLKCIRVEMAILDLRMNTMLIDILPDLAPEAAATVRGLIKPVKNRKAG